MNGATETAYAKINLALHVRRREPDGYHAIETLFAFAEDGDVLTLEAEPGLRLTGEFGAVLGDEPDNIVTRAARAFAPRFGVAEAGFTLDKRLPVAAGIGGGSADAAAALRLLARVHGVEAGHPALLEIAGGLGADVPACLLSVPTRGEGRGDELVPLDEPALAGLPLLLVNPRLPLATGPVFAAWDRIDRGPLGEGDALAVARAGRNDLEAPALALRPEIAEVLAALGGQGILPRQGEVAPKATEGEESDGSESLATAILERSAASPSVSCADTSPWRGRIVLARMSGSGATCFALFSDDAARDAAAAAIRAARPGWWTLATRLRS